MTWRPVKPPPCPEHSVYASSSGGGAPCLTSPLNTVAPSITGTVEVGLTVTAVDGTWTGTPTITYTRQWVIAGVDVSGSTGTTFVVPSGSTGKALSLRVTATNAQGVVVAVSAPYTIAASGTPTYAKWDSAHKGSAVTLSNSDLTAVGPETNGTVRTTFGSAAKFVVEFTSTGSPRLPIVGVGTASASLTDFPGSDLNGWGFYGLTAKKINNGVQTSFGTTWSPSSQAVMLYVDPVAGTIGVKKAGTDLGVMFTFAAGLTLYAMTGGDTNATSSNCTINTGQSAFSNTVPAGYPNGLFV